MIPGLPHPAAAWTLASTTAAAVSYADRGTSAIAASGILADLGWTESELGTVQSAFFLGYGLTQVAGGLLSEMGSGSGVGSLAGGAQNDSGEDSSYRTVLPLSLFLTGLTTLAFPAAASWGGPVLAAVDRFSLGLFEGLLLPSAMAGVSALVPPSRRATASSVLIAGCYLGSALAYGSAAALFSSPAVPDPAWPYVFYVNGVLAFLCLGWFREQFVFPAPADWLRALGGSDAISSTKSLLEDTVEVGMATVSSVSGRAILAAQVGQGALLYSIASWGPLYLERVGGVVPAGASGGDATAVASTAAAAASALILPQLTQAGVGVGVGTAADAFSERLGTVPTRRVLQGLSGMVPAAILWYLSGNSVGVASASGSIASGIGSPATLFGVAQTVSALSLGAVSVSHLEVAPRNAGTVYALGNVAAAVSGSVTVNLFGALLEAGGGSDFATPFRLVAAVSALGSLVYAVTVGGEPEIFVKSSHATPSTASKN